MNKMRMSELRRWLRPLGRNMCTRSRWLLVLLLLFTGITGIRAAEYITDLIVIGKYSSSDVNKQVNAYKNLGYTVLAKDLNTGAGSSSWYVYIGYKTSSSADPETGYVTDIIGSTKNVETMTYNGRTYKKVPTSENFNGDLNRGGSGADIFLYYTKERAGLSGHGDQKRVITRLYTSDKSSGAPICWADSYSGAMDANKGAGGDYIYIHMEFTTQTLSMKTHPTFCSDFTYDGKSHLLVPNAPAGNSGTMKYKVNDGSWSTSLPRATNVGTYKVYYKLEASFANSSPEYNKTVTINPPRTKPTNLKGEFNQENKKIVLTWDAQTLSGNYTDYWWVIYRDDTRIALLDYNAQKYTDTGFTTDATPKYDVYYVSRSWGPNTKDKDSYVSISVNARRSVPVDNFNAEGLADRVVLTWTSKGYPLNWGNIFKIYVDNETDPIYTITPDSRQTSFRWEHRSTDQHSSRKNGKDNNTHYTEEPLNGCEPHSYRVEGVIDSKVLNSASAQNKSIGNGTLFYSFKATKGVYPGTVKLNWHVDLQGSTASKTYIVERRTTEAPDGEDWVTLHRMSSNDEYLFYTDETPLPGVYYDYRITVQDKCENGQLIYNDATDIGFAQTTGTISGRITFGETGTAVAGVDVKAEKTSTSGQSLNQFYAMHFDNTSAQVTWAYDKTDYATQFNSAAFSMQMWIRADEFPNGCIASLKGDNEGALGITSDGELYFSDGTTNYNFGLKLTQGEYCHVTLARSGNTLTCYLVEKNADGVPVATHATKSLSGDINLAGATQFTLGNLNGYIDEFRLWKTCLDSAKVMDSYDHLLVGNEENLETYWTFDEGLRTQFFDYARTGTVYHEHHGKIGGSTSAAPFTPRDLALKAKTDINGNYLIQGIPFNGEGTNYAVVPTLGIHKFNPQQHLRYVSNNSLVHNSVDFDDVSSFTVKGTVYYANTTIPVAEAYLYVDGVMAAKDGEPIMTNSLGEYTISVPIGEHFFQVKKQSHEFSEAGRYPADPKGTGTRANFDRDLDGINFYDLTTVTVAGRVTGGDIEYEKPLGLSQSNNNIGKARLKLQLSNENHIINSGTEERTFETAAGKATAPAGANYLYVETDSTTGEWVAQLPPLRYEVTDLVMMQTRPENDAITKQDFSLPVLDATNPNLVYTDSIEVDGNWQKFSYVASAKMEYKATSALELTENKNGTFGMKSYTVKDINGVDHEVMLYDVDQDGNVVLDDNGKVKYTFGVTTENPNGYPVYQELSQYKYHLYAYERYTNYDGGKTVTDEVPLAGKRVIVKNQYASTTSVKTDETEFGEVYEVINDELELDDNGEAVYMFTAGFPNIQGDYTRGLSISYDNGGTTVDWDQNGKFKVLILGGLPTGNNFVTQGPDEVLMVLRDPPGTGSQTTWSKGTSVTKTKTTTSEYNNNTGVNSIIYAGVEVKTGSGVGFMVISDLDSKVNIKAGAEYSCTRTSGNTTTSVTTTTRDISTSDAMDFVGATGDVFIGSSKNIIFGACRAVDIKWDNVNNVAKLVQEDAIAMGEEFTTGFNYDQNYIKNVLIPNFETLRNALIDTVKTTNGVARPEKGAKEAKYISTLKADDPRFGSSNTDYEVWGTDTVQFSSMKDGVYAGPSYTMLLPIDYEKDQKGMQDMVNYYNVQIRKWEEELAKNEKAKVTAMNDRKKYLKENHSFSAGASITQTVSTDEGETTMSATSDGFNITLGLETGYKFSGLGLGVEVTEVNGGTWTEENSTETVNSASMSYTLVEDGDDDYLSVDVYTAPDKFGPIFVTRGGATSCPYEDEVVTEYYEPGTVISKKTVQIEKPEIEAYPQTFSGIPAGGSTNFQITIRNNSDTGEDLWFDLLVAADSNPDGLAVTMDDTSLNYGTTVLVKAGEPLVKTITISQSNPDVLTYENVKIRVASQCQKDNTSTYGEIADTTSFSAYFQPACSDIYLESSHSLVNTDTESPVTLSVSKYNYAMTSLTAVELQYKGINDPEFRMLKKYVKDEAQRAADPTLGELKALQNGAKLTYPIDLRTTDFTDKTYVFRAVTVCNLGGVIVNNESNEVEIVRDMSRPMLIATPSPASGVLTGSDDLLLTFNEDILSSNLTKANNFEVTGVLNEGEVAHDVALKLTGSDNAETDATFDLSGKSFSTSMWVNYTTDGKLLMHGTKDQNFTIAIEDGKLAVSVAGTKTTSSQTLPTDKWLYLNVSYDAETETVSAGYAMDATTVILMNNLASKAYEGNGPITLGGDNLNAKVQELTVWNSARTMSQAQGTMYTTKSKYTSGLIGYWQLNEGHGDVATDVARQRNMTLPSQNAWWIDGDNYALSLDGTKTAAVSIGSLNTTEDDDYLVETWFKADEQQDGVVSLMSTLKMNLQLNEQGKMSVVLRGDNTEAGYQNNASTLVCDQDLRDGQWHHVAVNVLKSTNGSGIIYVDGQQRKQIAAADMPEFFGESLLLGGMRVEQSYGVYSYKQLLKGAVDEVRIWKGRRTADVIRNNMYQRIKADEAGLVAYYPMEKLVKNAYGQMVSTATFNDTVTAGSSAEAALTFYAADGTKLTGDLTDLSMANTAALKPAPKSEAVDYSFVASERQIKVNLEEEAAKMEDCHITITVKGVKDVNSNKAEPITWSVLVKRNTLKWLDSNLAITKTGTEEKQFTATIENTGSESESWSLSGLPTWLSANVEGGSLMPLSSAQLTFTVAESLPIGTYETTVYLTGLQGINAPLNITVTSEGNAPNWAATPGESTMTIVGVLNIDGMQSNDSKDMVAAFRGTECVGVASPEYLSRYDSYMIMMNIYGDEEAELIYKAYDASTGTVYPSVSVSDQSAYTFVGDKAIGTFAAPAVFTPLNEIEQDLSHDRASWMWFSLYAQPKVNTPSVVFKDAQAAITTISDGTNTLTSWIGNLNSFDYDKMYKLNANAPFVESIIGEPTNPADIDITLNSGWTWIGYPCQASNSIDAAFAGAAPSEGDIVKSQSGFAIYTEGEWVGLLTSMQPGVGYMYQNTLSNVKTFRYPKPTMSGRMNAPRRAAGTTEGFTVETQDNMTMIAAVMNGDELIEEAQVSVFAGTELRGLSTQALRDGLHFLTIGGEGNQSELLTFVVTTPDGEFFLSQTETFKADAMMGSMNEPYVLQLGDATSIDMAVSGTDIKSIHLYDAGGRLVRIDDQPGRLITKDDLKRMPAGVYYQKVVYQNGQTCVMKVMQ